MLMMSKKYFQIYWARSSATQNGKSGFKKKHRDFFFCIFFQSTHQVGMKNIVEHQKYFFAYFNALKTYGEFSVFILPQNSFTHQSSKVEGQKSNTNEVSKCVQNKLKNSSFHFENWSKQMQQTGTHVMSKQYSTGLLSNTGNSARNAKPVMLKNFQLISGKF